MNENLQPTVSTEEGVTIISLGSAYENLDESLLDGLKGFILEQAEGCECPKIVLDLSHTKFFGSAFIELLFRIWNRVKARDGGEFCLCGLTPYCQEVIDVTHLDRLWAIYGSRDDAVAALKD